jgi:hypothetical protein
VLRHRIGHFLLAVATLLVVTGATLPLVFQGALSDMDSYVRLIRLQEALDHGRWFGDAVSRSDSGHGMPVRWAHLLDGVILLFRAPLALFLPADRALFWAGALVGPVAVGLLGAACAWAPEPLVRRQWLWWAPICVASASPIDIYGVLGDATHHVPLAALAVLAWGAGARAAFGSMRAGILLGLFGALGIWLSPEAMPYAMMAFGAVFLSWCWCPSRDVAAALAAAGTTFLGVMALALLADPPHAGWLAPEIDELSISFLALAAIVCALSLLPGALCRLGLPKAARFVAMGMAGAAGAALWLLLFPGYLRGLAGIMTPEQVAAYFGHNAEFKPIVSVSLFMTTVGPAVVVAAAAVWIGLRAWGIQASRPAGVLWLYAAGCTCLGITLACVYVRFAAYPAAAAAIMLPVLLDRLSHPNLLRWRVLLRPGTIAVFLLLPLVFSFPQASSGGEQAGIGARSCNVKDAAPLLAPFGDKVVLANVNDGPELLYRTRVKIVGALYQAGIDGFMRLRAAWRARQLEDVPPEVRVTNAQFILICPGAEAGTAIVDGPRTTLLDRLNRRDAPLWLHPLVQDPKTGWDLYEIAPHDAALSAP